MSLTEKNSYWTRVVEDIERKAVLSTKEDAIKKYDFSLTLPKKLKKRVAKILPYEFEKYDKNVFIEEATIETPKSYGGDVEEEAAMKKGSKVRRRKYFLADI